MSLNKKAIGWEAISKWIFAIIVVIILWVLFTNFGDFLFNTGNKAACQNWVDRNSVPVLKNVIGNSKSSPCVTTQETIKDSDKNKVYEKIAKNMYDCWDQYGRGESDFYSDFNFGSSEAYCRICSEIKFDEKVKKQIKEMDIDEFEIYLNNHNPPNHKETYADFFIKTENSKINFGEGKLSLDKNLYTIFIVNKVNPASASKDPVEAITGFLESVSNGILSTGAFVLGIESVGLGKVGRNVVGNVGKNVFKGASGSTKLLRAPAGGINIGGKLYKSGQFLPKSASGATKGNLYVIAGTFIIGTTIYVLSDASVLMPSIHLIESNDAKELNQVCNYVYYNPEENPLDFIKK
jgi:hypothetical protein